MRNEPKRLHSETAAKALAAHLNRDAANDEDGWTYVPKHIGRGCYVVEVFDEDGEIAGAL